MSKFKCKCLNVTIHVKEKATREAEGTAFVSENCSEPFFTKELYEVELAVGGITKVICSVRFSIRTGNTKGYFKVASSCALSVTSRKALARFSSYTRSTLFNHLCFAFKFLVVYRRISLHRRKEVGPVTCRAYCIRFLAWNS